MLKFIKTKGIPASDDISLRCCRRRETSPVVNEALERAFGEYMVSSFTAMLNKKKGMMSSHQLCRKSPPHFSLSFLKPDTGLQEPTMTVVCHGAISFRR